MDNGASEPNPAIPPESLMQWITENDTALRLLFPQEWERHTPELIDRIWRGLSGLGCHFEDYDHLMDCCLALEQFGICESKDMYLRRRARDLH